MSTFEEGNLEAVGSEIADVIGKYHLFYIQLNSPQWHASHKKDF